MSNINQLVMENLFSEGARKQVLAALSGLGGAVTGGSVIGGVQAHQRTASDVAQKSAKGDTKGALQAQQKGPMRNVRRSLAGSVPIICAVSNYQQQKKLDELRKKHGIE